MWRIVILVVVMSAAPAAAQSFFSSSPGKLSKSHASLDSQAHCNDCHVNGTRAISETLCLGCHDHKDLAKRIANGEGFHAKPDVKSKKCESCHDEHRGPNFDVMGWKAIQGGEQGFRARHGDLAGWKLDGKHATTPCAECHTATNTQGLRLYMGVERTCGNAGCHLSDQPHKLQRPALLDCSRCHTERVWRPTKDPMVFDHDQSDQAGMPLLGAHKGQACDKCHPKDLFNLPFAKPAACNNSGCHTPKHPPNHLFDQRQCDWCHSPTFGDFKVRTQKALGFFDHDGFTRFDLGGAQARHSKISCYDCHTERLGQRKPALGCESCHAKDNRHGDRFAAFGSPPKCGTCHTSASFGQQRFDHVRNTGYDLTAKHGQTGCRSCHRGTTPADFERFTSGACKDCHKHAAAHASPKKPSGPWKSNQCLKCHARPGDRVMRNQAELEREWHGPTSDFPLVKGHKGLARSCAKCHTNRAGVKTTTFDEESPECGDRCHQDTLHRGSLGKTCTPCHTSGEWAALKFDHDVPVFPDGTPGFALRGEHRNNKCEACHGAALKFKDTPRDCSAAGCHGDEDVHKGRLGNNCGKCHQETGDMLFNHNTMSAFHLDGKHLQVACSDCHPSPTFKPRPKNCFGCHPEPAVHKGTYGTSCEQCHTTRTWDDIKPLHDVGDFSLKGMHNNVACERCHRDNRPLAGSGNLCINCHRQDDVHNNSLSPKCGECHTQWSFTPARFDHMRVGCSLTGLHRTIACFDCHTNGNYAAITAECGGCHRDDSIRHGAQKGPMDGHNTYFACAGCHNANTWLGAPAAAGGRESVCR